MIGLCYLVWPLILWYHPKVMKVVARKEPMLLHLQTQYSFPCQFEKDCMASLFNKVKCMSCSVPPKKDLAEGPKATDEEDKKEENQEKLEKTLLNAKIKFLEDRSRTSPADDEFYDKLASELLEADPKLLKVLLWQLNKAKEQYKKNRKVRKAQTI